MFPLTKLPVSIDPFMEQRQKLRIFVHEPFSEKRFLVLVDPSENIAHLQRKIERVYMANYFVNDVKVKAVSLQGYFINKNSIIKEALRDCDLITCDLLNYSKLEKVKLEPQNKSEISNENDENSDTMEIPKKKIKLNTNMEQFKEKLKDKKNNMLIEPDLIQKMAKTIFTQNNQGDVINESKPKNSKNDEKLQCTSKTNKNSTQKPFDSTIKNNLKPTETATKTQSSDLSNKTLDIKSKRPEKSAKRLNSKVNKTETTEKQNKPDDTEKIKGLNKAEKIAKVSEEAEKNRNSDEKQAKKPIKPEEQQAKKPSKPDEQQVRPEKSAEKLNSKIYKAEKKEKPSKLDDIEKIKDLNDAEKPAKDPEEADKNRKPDEKQASKPSKPDEKQANKPPKNIIQLEEPEKLNIPLEKEQTNETIENENQLDMALKPSELQFQKPEKPENSQISTSPRKELRSKKISKPSPTEVKSKKIIEPKKKGEEKGNKEAIGIYEAAYKKIMSKKNEGKEDEKKEKKEGKLIVIVEDNENSEKASEERVSPKVFGLNYKLKKHLEILEDF